MVSSAVDCGSGGSKVSTDTGKTIKGDRKPIWSLTAMVCQHLMKQNEKLWS